MMIIENCYYCHRVRMRKKNNQDPFVDEKLFPKREEIKMRLWVICPECAKERR